MDGVGRKEMRIPAPDHDVYIESVFDLLGRVTDIWFTRTKFCVTNKEA